MQRIFRIGDCFPVPDGTVVCPFLNPNEARSSSCTTRPGSIAAAGAPV